MLRVQNIVSEVINGGEPTGGAILSTTRKVIQIYGGQYQMQVGGDAVDHVNISIVAWRTFCHHYSDGDTNFAVKLREIMSEIFNIKDLITLGKEDWYLFARTVNELDEHNFVKFVSKVTGTHEKSKLMLGVIFDNWKSLLEKYVKELLYASGERVKALEKLWFGLNVEHNLNLSSPILYFCTKEGPQLPDCMKWILPIYTYAGFCSKIPLERLNMLLEFPIDELSKQIVQAGGRPIVLDDIQTAITEIAGLIEKKRDSAAKNALAAVGVAAVGAVREYSWDALQTEMDIYLKRLVKVRAQLDRIEIASSAKIELLNKINTAIAAHT